MQALVVDDSRAMRMVLRRMLADCGFGSVAEASNGLEALDLIDTGIRPSVAFVDWNMPEMTGIEFLREVRSRLDRDALRVVMVSSEASSERIGEALESGADEYLVKPFDSAALAEKLLVIDLPRGD